MVAAIFGLSGEATLLHSSGVIHVPSYGGIIWLKHEEMETNLMNVTSQLGYILTLISAYG